MILSKTDKAIIAELTETECHQIRMELLKVQRDHPAIYPALDAIHDALYDRAHNLPIK